MGHALYLCSGTLGRVPWEDKARAAAAAGFAGLSMYLREYRQLRRQGWQDAAVRDLLDGLGLGVAELDGGVMTLETADGAAEAIQAAAAVGARSVTVLETTGWQPAAHPDQAAASLGEVCDMAADDGLLVLIEPFAWSTLADHRTAADLLARAERPNGGLMLDTWHLLRGPERGRLGPQVDPALVQGIQVNDVDSPSRGVPGLEELSAEGMHRRLLPGDGTGDIAGLLADLHQRGVRAPLGAEVFSDDLLALSPTDAARRVMRAMRSVLPGG